MTGFVLLLGIIGLTTGQSVPQPVSDTPEVVAAKEAHFAAFAKAKHEAEVQDNAIDSLRDQKLTSGKSMVETWGAIERDLLWKNNVAALQQSSLSRSPEVQFGSQRPADGKSDQETQWKGPVALPPGFDETGAPLPVQDTPEVADAKAKHLLAVARAVSPGPAVVAQEVPTSTLLPVTLFPIQSVVRTTPLLFTPTPVTFNNTNEILSAGPILVNFGIFNVPQHRSVPLEPAPIWEIAE